MQAIRIALAIIALFIAVVVVPMLGSAVCFAQMDCTPGVNC